MKPVSVNSDNRLADRLIELKRHIMHCRNCQVAVKTRDRAMMCDHTLGLVITAVAQFDALISRRLAVRRSNDNVFYACPDLSAHGKTWAMTAEPLVAAEVQEGLW